MARLRNSAAVGLAGSANPGAGGVVLPPRPNAPRPPVNRSSLLPSYTVEPMVTTDPRTTKDGSSLSSDPEQAAVRARHESRKRFDTAPPRAIVAHRRERGYRGQCKKTCAQATLGYAARDAEPARAGRPFARVRARRRPHLAAHAPPAAAAGSAGAGAEDPRGGPAGEPRRLALQEDRVRAGSAGAVHLLELLDPVGQLYAAAAAGTGHRVRGGPPRRRSAQAGRRRAAGVRAEGGGRPSPRADAGRAATRRDGGHRLQPHLRADRAALRARAQRLRGGGERGQGPAGARAGFGAAVAALAVHRTRVLGSGLRRQAFERAVVEELDLRVVRRLPPAGARGPVRA